MLIFTSQKYEYLGKELESMNESFKFVDIESKNFPDGESYNRITDTKIVKQKDVLLIAGTDDVDYIFLLETATTLVTEGIRSLHVFIPFYSYSTQERQVKKGEYVKAKMRALFLSKIPKPHQGTSFYFFDLHTGGIPYYFEDSNQVEHIYGKSIVDKAISEIKKDCSNLILISPDVGRAKWVDSLANDFNIQSDYIIKKRIDGETVESQKSSIQDLTDKTAIIYDDMIRSGSSIVQAVNICKEHNAKNIFVITSHGVFCSKAIEKFELNKNINKVFCSNSLPEKLSTKVSYISLIPTFYKKLIENINMEDQ